MTSFPNNLDVKRSWDSDKESTAHVEKEMSILSPEKRMKRNSSSGTLRFDESVFEFPTTSLSSSGMNNAHGLLDYGASSSMGPPEMIDRVPRTPIDVDGRHSPKTPKSAESADVRMLADALISPLNIANSPTATIRRAGIANVPSSKDWGSPLGKEFTNVGEGFCFSDAVQRSHSPINIDHNNHKNSSSLLHQKSSSQSGGQGRNNGRGGGEGPDGGLERSDGGANGNKGGPSMLGMGRHHSGEEGGAHPHRPSSSSSSNHHMNMGHASNTSNSRQHHGSGLHVHTTGTELEPSSPRRGGPQSSSSSSSSSSSGSRGMNRGGTVGESDMMVSPTSTEFMTEFEGLASPMMVGLDHDSQEHFMCNKQALAARLGGGNLTAGGGGGIGWGQWANSAGIDSPGLAAITAAAEIHGLGSMDDLVSEGNKHHGAHGSSNKAHVGRGPSFSSSPIISTMHHHHNQSSNKNGMGMEDDQGDHQYHGKGGVHGGGMAMAPTTNLFGMMGGGEYSPGGGEDGLLLDMDEEGYHQQVAHAGRHAFATSAFGAFSQLSPFPALQRRKKTDGEVEGDNDNDHGDMGGRTGQGQSSLGNSWESGMTVGSAGGASGSSSNDSELDGGGGGVSKSGAGRGRSVKFGKNHGGSQKASGQAMPSRGGTKRRSNSADSADYSGDSGVEAECRTSESMYLLMKAAGSISSSGDSSTDANRNSGTKGGKGGSRGRKSQGPSVEEEEEDGEGALSGTMTDTKNNHHHRRGSGGDAGSNRRGGGRGSGGAPSLASGGPHGASSSWGSGAGSGGEALTPAAAVAIQSLTSKPIICNCKRSRCLKLYCDCFRFSKFCDMCNCMDCANMGTREDERQAAIAAITDRNPDAFKPILSTEVDPGGSESASALHKSGCNCKKSQCLKKYCECFNALVPCSDRCKCLECKNTSDLYAQTMKTDTKNSSLPSSAHALAKGDPSLLHSSSKQLPASSSSSSGGGGVNGRARGGSRGAVASEEDTGYGRPYSYNVSAGANASAYSSLHTQQPASTAGGNSGGGAIGLRSPALLAGSRSGTRANSLLSAHMNMSGSAAANRQDGGDDNIGSNTDDGRMLDDRNYDQAGGGKVGVSRGSALKGGGSSTGSGLNEDDIDGGDPMTVLSATKHRSGSVGSGSESMASGTGTMGTEPGDSVGSRLIRNLSLMQGLDAQGQGLAGQRATSSSSSSQNKLSSSVHGNGGGGGGGGSSGLHTPPRLQTSMSLESMESHSNVMHPNPGGGSSSSSSGAISVSSPIGLLAVLCEQRRDEEMSRSTHTTNSSPRGNILDIYEKNIARTGGETEGGADGSEGKGPAPAPVPVPAAAIAKTTTRGSRSSSGGGGGGGGGGGVTRGSSSRGGRSGGVAEEVSVAATKTGGVDSSSSSSSQTAAAAAAAHAAETDTAPATGVTGVTKGTPSATAPAVRRTSRGGGKTK